MQSIWLSSAERNFKFIGKKKDSLNTEVGLILCWLMSLTQVPAYAYFTKDNLVFELYENNIWSLYGQDEFTEEKKNGNVSYSSES